VSARHLCHKPLTSNRRFITIYNRRHDKRASCQKSIDVKLIMKFFNLVIFHSGMESRILKMRDISKMHVKLRIEKQRVKSITLEMMTNLFKIESDRSWNGSRTYGHERRKQPPADGICFKAKISLPPHLPKAD